MNGTVLEKLFIYFLKQVYFNYSFHLIIAQQLNEGYISLKTAFEYIDPDHLTHLLSDEFRYVLSEFNIFFDEDAVYEKFLKK